MATRSNTSNEEICVGIFWECGQTYQLELQYLCHVILAMGDFISTKNTIDKSCVLSLHLSSSEQQMFKDYGFKVLDKENSSLEQIALIPEILLWLWDLERSRRNVRTCIVLLTENVEYCSYLHELKDRGVYVVCITGFRSHSGHPIFDEFKNACDILLEQRTLIHHTSRWLSGEYQTLNELLALFLAPFIQKFHSIKEENMSRAINLNGASSFSEESTTQKKVSNHGAKQLGPHMSLSSDDATDTQSISTMNPPASQYPPTLDDFPRRDPYSSIVDQFTHEQHQLQQELMNAVYAYNVKSAVSTLRKMYTKQSKTFRIPVILGLILPDTSAMITNGRNDLLNVALCFILDCIHWCFGVQKGENFESFKYKMNTNIARWLLRECAKKGIPSAVSNVVYNATIKLMNLIMDNYLELNFTYELLQAMNIPQPIPRLIPYIHMWLGSSSSSMKMRVHEFLYEHPEFAPYLAAESNKPYPTHPQLSSFEDGSPHPHDVNDKELEFKLLNLLEKSVNGELGARIPTLYREEYGEPLKLRGRKLKDILMETGKVEMYGIDGPGDKLFRIIPELLPDRPPPGFMSFMESYHPRSATTSDEFDHLPTHHSGNDFNINDYLSREMKNFRHAEYSSTLGNINEETARFHEIPENSYQQENFYQKDSYLNYLSLRE